MLELFLVSIRAMEVLSPYSTSELNSENITNYVL